MEGSKNREGFDSEAFVVGRKVENGTKINGELQTKLSVTPVAHNRYKALLMDKQISFSTFTTTSEWHIILLSRSSVFHDQNSFSSPGEKAKQMELPQQRRYIRKHYIGKQWPGVSVSDVLGTKCGVRNNGRRMSL